MNDTYNTMLNDPEMKEIVESFLIETKEILESLDVDLIGLENSPEDAELLNKVFRSFHTIKGTSGFLGLDKLTAVTHKCEDILNKLRKGEAKLNSDIMDGILLAEDTIKGLLVTIENEQTENFPVENTIEKLGEVLDILNGNIKKDSEENIDPKVVNLPNEEEKQAEESQISFNDSNSKPTAESTKKNKNTDNSIRVDVSRLDELLNIASELVLGRNRLSQVNSDVSLEYEGTQISRDLAETTKLIDLMTNELQLVVMKTRMVKIGKVFNRFPRLVRDLAKEANKKVKLEIQGEETELDKTLIEEINDPLVHLIRNSADHGLEGPEERKKNGKNPEGIIKLSAEHEGNHIIISITDDGRGIDPIKIKEKAVSKGLLSAEKAKELSTQDALNLIFLPGFSTAEKVTNVSGRGVGMDVVKTNVTKLRGIINIESTVGKGTKIFIKLPLTLAIIPGMIVKVENQTAVIPLNSVLEVVREHADNIKTVNGNEVIKRRDQVIPLVDINDILFNENFGNDKVWQYIVIVGIAEKKYGIKVDSLIGQKEVVIKSLGTYLGNIHGIAGSTILGDGKVVMILDIAELIHKLRN